MRKRTKLPEDPVVEEVRSIRRALWEEAGGTVEGLIRIIEQQTKRRRRPGRSGAGQSSRRPNSRRAAE
jgi:hypothetical protein